LAAAIGAPQLATDGRFSTVAQRVAHLPELIEELEARTVEQSVAHWAEVIGAAGVPCGPVNDLADTVRDPIIAEREVITAIPGHPAVPELATVDLPFRVNGQPLGSHMSPPMLGQHSAEVFDELAQPPAKETASR